MNTRHLLSGLCAAVLMLSGLGGVPAYSQGMDAPTRADVNDPRQILSDAKDLPMAARGKVRCINGKMDGKEKVCFKLTGLKPNEAAQIVVYSNNSPISVAAGTVVDATKELKDLHISDELMQPSVGYATLYNIGFIDGCVDRYVTLSGAENEFLIIAGIVDSSAAPLPPADDNAAETHTIPGGNAPQGDMPKGETPQLNNIPQGENKGGNAVTGSVSPILVPQEDKSFFSPLELGVMIGLGLLVVILACLLLFKKPVNDTKQPKGKNDKNGQTPPVPNGKNSYMVRFQCENGPRLKTLLTPEKLLHKPVTFGRSHSNKIVLNDPKLSSHHGCFVYHEGRIAIIDTNSKNGIYVNGQRIRVNTPVCVSSRCTILAGNVRITLSHQ